MVNFFKRNKFVGGCIVDTFDSRDILLSSIQEPVEIPEEFKREMKLAGIKNSKK